MQLPLPPSLAPVKVPIFFCAYTLNPTNYLPQALHYLIFRVSAYLVCIAIPLIGQKNYYCSHLLNSPPCSMDSMIIIEASKLRMKMKEVTGTRCIVGNLEGVVFEVTLE